MSSTKVRALILLASGLLAACGGPMGGTSAGQSMPETTGHGDMGGMHGSESGGEAPPTVDGAETIEVTATDLAFDRESIELTAGEPLNITLTNDGDVFHDLHVEGTEFMLDADPGATVSGALTIDEPGTYPFRCTVPGHASAGMQGSITVAG